MKPSINIFSSKFSKKNIIDKEPGNIRNIDVKLMKKSSSVKKKKKEI